MPKFKLMENKMISEEKISSKEIQNVTYNALKAVPEFHELIKNMSAADQKTLQKPLDENITPESFRVKIDLLIKVASDMINKEKLTKNI